MALAGALAASVTPLRASGGDLDDDAFDPLVDFFVEAGLDGILALGTAGEGILLEERERRLVADLFLQAADRRLQVAVQCGAQTTAETVALAAHAAEVGADAVVVIGPPYFPARRARPVRALSRGRARRARRSRSTSTSSSRRAGTPSSRPCSSGCASDAPNLVGLKVSDTPFERFSRYLLPDLDIFVGPEALIHDGLAAGAVGAVSALASAFPRDVAAVVRDPSSEGAARLAELRRSSSASRGRRRSSACSAVRAFRCGRTCGRRSAGSPSRSATSSTAWHDVV